MKMFALGVAFSIALFLSSPLAGQHTTVTDPEVVHPYQRVTVANLAVVTATDTSRPAAAKAALAIVISASKLKCDPGSQIESVAEGNAAAALPTLVTKISGASCAVNGRTLRVTASFVPNGAIQANDIVASLKEGKPLLASWKDTLYVLHGVIYDEHVHYSGRQDNVIRELLLIDPRYSDKRRLVVFERERDNFAEVEGFASVSVTAQ